MGNPSPSKTYFAAANRQDIGKRLWEKLQPLINDSARDHRNEMANAYAHVYGRDVGYGITSGVTRGGERGEIAQLRVPTAPATARAKHAIVTSAKVTWKPEAADGGSASARSTGIALDVLENEWKSKGLALIYSLWVKRAIYFSEAFVFAEWDRSAGPPLAAVNGVLKTQGDIRYHLIQPWDVFRDNSAKSYEGSQWKYAPLLKNRFDLARADVQLPDGRQGKEAAQAILEASNLVRSKDIAERDLQDSDLVPVWHFIHEPSDSLPLGRHVALISSELVLVDEPLRGPNATYEESPLYRLADEEMVDSPHAWATFWDTLGAQEMSDGISTAVATRATTLSNPILAYEKGSDIQPDVLGNGWRSWGYLRGGNPPAEVEFRPVQREMIEYNQDLKGDIRATMGINDVSVGQPQSAQMNAEAFALLASMAVQQASPLQESSVNALGRLGTGVLKTLTKRVLLPRSVRGVSGKSVKYTGKDLKGLDKVRVEIGNPLEQTTAGKKLILDQKIQLGYITSEEKYDQQLATGRSDFTTRRNVAEMTLVIRENEELLRGEVPAVDFWQNHQLHYRENSAAGLETDDPAIKANVTRHMDEHYFALFGVDKAMDPLGPLRERWLLGMPPGPGQEMPLAPPGGAPGAGAPPGAPPGPPAPGAGDAAMAPAAVTQAPDVGTPNNPLTQQPFDNVTGGGVVAAP